MRHPELVQPFQPASTFFIVHTYVLDRKDYIGIGKVIKSLNYFIQNKGSVNREMQTLGHLQHHFIDSPAVIRYNLFNEPFF
jgi:hypothetical protein